jgi:hypothetical protein
VDATAGVEADAPAVSSAPQSPQNLCPGGLAAPQEEQSAARALPHEPQNLWPAGFSVPQFEHALTSEDPSSEDPPEAETAVPTSNDRRSYIEATAA